MPTTFYLPTYTVQLVNEYYHYCPYMDWQHVGVLLLFIVFVDMLSHYLVYFEMFNSTV